MCLRYLQGLSNQSECVLDTYKARDNGTVSYQTDMILYVRPIAVIVTFYNHSLYYPIAMFVPFTNLTECNHSFKHLLKLKLGSL